MPFVNIVQLPSNDPRFYINGKSTGVKFDTEACFKIYETLGITHLKFYLKGIHRDFSLFTNTDILVDDFISVCLDFLEIKTERIMYTISFIDEREDYLKHDPIHWAHQLKLWLEEPTGGGFKNVSVKADYLNMVEKLQNEVK